MIKSRFPFLRAAAGCALLLGPLAATGLRAQEKKIEFPAASPHAGFKQRVGVMDVEVDYSRPSKNNREIFGGLVPFGEVWRTGANASTKLTFSDAVKLEGKDIPAGKYALYTIPNADEWTVIVYKDTSLWGSTKYKQADDLVRFTVKPETLAAPTETFTIGVSDLKEDAATLFLEWDKTRVPVRLTADTVAKVSAQIAQAAAAPEPPAESFYFQAANFYLAHNLDLNKALEWMNRTVEKNPKAYFFLERKAQIQAKLGDKPGAIASAEKAIELINADPAEVDPTAVPGLQKFIAGLR